MRQIEDRAERLYRRQIDADMDTMSEDELRLFAALSAKYVAARAKYGPLNLRTDTRNFRLEARAERIDMLFYDVADVLADDLKREANGQ